MIQKNIGKRIWMIVLVLVMMTQTLENGTIHAEETESVTAMEAPVTSLPVSTETAKTAKTKKKVVKKKRKTKKKKIKLQRPKVKVKKKLENQVKITWKKVKKAKSYIIYKKEQGKKFRKIYQISKKSFVDKNTKGNTKYYYRVVACRKVSGKLIKSRHSKTIKVYVRAKKKKVKHEKADVVICGECYVEGMDLFAKNILPKNYRLVYKVGISTYGVLNTNFVSYQGKTITAIERIAYYRPKQVFFLVGMNEASNPNPKNTVNNYKKMIGLLKSINPNVKVILIALPPVAKSHVSGFANNEQIVKYNKAYRKLAKKMNNVYFYSAYRGMITDSMGYLKAYADGGDGGHWSSKATIDIVKKLVKYSNKLSKEKR